MKKSIIQRTVAVLCMAMVLLGGLLLTEPAMAATVKTNMSKTMITVKNAVYNGKALKPAVTVTYKNKKLKENTDYTLKYASNKEIGSGTVTVTGKGSYTGSVKKTFKINPAPVPISSVKDENGKTVISWKKAANITGYEIAYGESKEGEYTKLAAVAASKTSYSESKVLKDGMYVKLRAYKKVGKTTFYSSYSDAEQVRKKGKIEIPEVTDASLTAPDNVHFAKLMRIMPTGEGPTVEVESNELSLCWENTADREIEYWWQIQLYDDMDRRLSQIHYSVNIDKGSYSFDIPLNEAATVKTIVITPMDEGADGYLGGGSEGDDLMGASTVFECSLVIQEKTGKGVELTKTVNQWHEDRYDIALSAVFQPYTQISLRTVDTQEAGREFARGYNVLKTGEIYGLVRMDEAIERMWRKDVKTTVYVFSDAVVENGNTASYTVTGHPVTAK